MRIHSSRVFQGRRRTDTWVHQNGKVLGLATLWGSREKRSSSAVDVPWERRFAFRAKKREGTAEKDGRRKRRRRRRGRVTVVSYFREILNCELRERKEREREREIAFGEYRHDMHYTMDARFSRLISLNFAVPPPFPRGIARYRSRKSNLRKYTYARATNATRRRV